MLKNKSPALPFRSLNIMVLTRAKYAISANITATNTRRNLINTAKSFNKYIQDNKIQISTESIRAFLSSIKMDQSPATWNLSRQNLKTALKLQPEIAESYPLKMVVEEIFRDIKPFILDKKISEYLTSQEVDLLVQKSPKRLGLMIRFLFVTGCRISEMIDIRFQDIYFREFAQIRIIGKGNKQRSVFISKKLYSTIRSVFNGRVWLFETRKGVQHNRSTIWRQLKRAGHRILGKEIHPHLLRHSTANYLLQEKGKSAKYVSEYLGHSSPAITLEMYIHEQPQEDIISLFA